MTMITDKTALIIIDVQDGLDDPVLGKRNNPDAESNMAQAGTAYLSCAAYVHPCQFAAAT